MLVSAFSMVLQVHRMRDESNWSWCSYSMLQQTIYVTRHSEQEMFITKSVFVGQNWHKRGS